MFTLGHDFVCETGHGIIRCIPRTPEAASAFKVLQLQLVRLVPQLPEPPDVTIEADGIIGPSMTLAMQMILGRIVQSFPHETLLSLALAPPEEAIPTIASLAMEISGVIDQVITSDPNAIASPTSPQHQDEDPIDLLKRVLTKKRILAGSATLLGLGGLGLVASASSRRALGLVDRSRFLPPSDGSNEEDEDEDEDDDDGEDEENTKSAIKSIPSLPPESAADEDSEDVLASAHA